MKIPKKYKKISFYTDPPFLSTFYTDPFSPHTQKKQIRITLYKKYFFCRWIQPRQPRILPPRVPLVPLLCQFCGCRGYRRTPVVSLLTASCCQQLRFEILRLRPNPVPLRQPRQRRIWPPKIPLLRPLNLPRLYVRYESMFNSKCCV